MKNLCDHVYCFGFSDFSHISEIRSIFRNYSVFMIYSRPFTESYFQAFLDILGFSDVKELAGLVPSDFSASEQPYIDDPVRAAWKISNLALQYGSHKFEWKSLQSP